MSAILLFGIVAYRELPVSDLPNVDFPTITVNAALPGADPDTMAAAVATPLERQFSTIAGVDSMTSVNTQGASSITLQFNLSRSLDAAAQDVQAAIAMAQGQLPPDMPSPPSYRKANPADQPVLYLALSSPTLPLSEVNEYAETLLAQRISMVSGVAQVQVYGSQKYAVRVQLDPRELANRGIGLDEVVEAVQSGNVNLPTGVLWGKNQAFSVQTTGQLMAASAYRPLMVAYRNGSPVRLQDLGDVLDSVETDKVASWREKTRAVVLAVQRQPGTNTIEVVDAVKDLLGQFNQMIPASVSLDILGDRSESIRESVEDVKLTLLLTIALVVLVIFLFLRKLSATFIPSLAVPMSIIGTFAVMYLLDYSIDNLSLMALTLSVGFVVDDAIVMLENIVRHIEMGERPYEAALKGSREISFTVLSMTISLAVVFLPVLFMGGVVGRLLREFSVTIGVAILVSGVVSLTLTPMLCSRFLKGQHDESHGFLFNLFERFFDGMLRMYDITLRAVLRHRFATLMVSFVIIAASVWLLLLIPKGFLPTEDTSQMFAITEAQQGISFDDMKRHQLEVADFFAKDPNVETFFSGMGGGRSASAGNQGRLYLHLKPRSEREKSVDELIEQWRPELAKIPGIQVFMQNPPPIRLSGQFTKSLYTFILQSPDTEELYKYTPLLEARMRQLPGLQDVTTDLQISNPQVDVRIDRDKASALGVSARKVEDALFSAYASRQVSTIFAPNNDYAVILELKPEYQRDPAALSMLYIRNDRNELVPIDSVARITRSVGPLTVNHSGQLPAVTVSFNLSPGVALGDAVNEINELAAEVLPQSITTSFQGTAQAFQESEKGLGVLLIMTILVIYIVLGILYESFIHPLTILSGLPSAGLGALVTLLIFHPELNLYGFVGIIMLVGIVKKNAIMMIDFAIVAEREHGKGPLDAIYEGCLVRFRPIMMTTMAALMGTLPIAIGIGAGADARRPLGLAVVGGLMFSQLVTLYITPVYYTYLDSFQSWLQRSFRKSQPEAEPAPTAGD
ncbi:MAG: efflux RND transporter permease subunit [Bryobacterales bacterium]